MHLPQLMELFEGRCIFCDNEVMMVRDAERLNLAFDNNYIFLADGSKIRVATKEHVIPKSRGGLDTVGWNLKLACYDCNQSRAKTLNQKPKGRYICRRCKNSFKSKKKRRHCHKCRSRILLDNREYILCMMGHA